MLAWVHQTTASENEFLESLFGVKEKRRMVGSERDAQGLDEEEALVRDALDRDLEGLGRPLKVSSIAFARKVANAQLRIQQTIKSQEGIIMAYRIANLLQFYLITMRRTIGSDALLSSTMKE